MEQAVARETWEETGLRIDVESVRYIASQPWPFPQSVMMGFVATADDKWQEMVLDKEEIVSADWFDRDTVRRATTIPGATMELDVANAVDPSISVMIQPKESLLDNSLMPGWKASFRLDKYRKLETLWTGFHTGAFLLTRRYC